MQTLRSMRLLLLALPTLLALTVAVRADEPAGARGPGGLPVQRRCTLVTSVQAADASRTAGCLACHDQGHAGGASHPVGIAYEGTALRRGASFRAAADVVARGIFLPEGRIECVTCHDPRSHWRNHLALPRGTAARPAVDPRRRETYARPRGAAEVMAAGAEVTPTPLCLACHAMD